MKRQVFFSFHYQADVWRAGQVRNMGVVDDTSTWSDNDWEKVRRTTDSAIKNWIDGELKMRSCVVVLIGAETANRKWVRYEIEKAYELNKGIVGVYANRLCNQYGQQSVKGENPFDHIRNYQGLPLSRFVEVIDAPYQSSTNVYDYIKQNLPDYIERAISKAGTY